MLPPGLGGTGHRCLLLWPEDSTSNGHGVQCGREAGIGDHLQDRLDDLLPARADVQRRPAMAP